MLFLFLAIAHTDAQEARHDHEERKIAHRIQAEQEAISDIWRPNAKLVSDYRRAQNCYTKFHLYKVPNCDAPLAQVETDFGNLQIARVGVH
jgi:hypothetical protein